MRGVNLDVFDFDYDLTWAAFFMNANEKIYGRYGGRDEGEADAHLTLTGLKYAMRQGLAAYQHDPNGMPPGGKKGVRTVEQYPAASRLKEGACIHCHQVNDFRRREQQATGDWKKEYIWLMYYPQPANVGLTLDVDQGDKVSAVAADSVASHTGLRAGDILKSVNDQPVASFGDVQYALHNAPASGQIPVTWERGGKSMSASLTVAPGWNKTDISWRASMYGIDPTPGVGGPDMPPDQKQALGFAPDHLAFRQGQFMTKAVREAGLQRNDVIYGIDDKDLSMTPRQFNAYVRLNYKVGDHVHLNVIRDGQRIKIPMVLPERDVF
jgi:serine protease Do